MLTRNLRKAHETRESL